MKDKQGSEVERGLKLVLQELQENPFRKFNFAFALMSIIPFLVFFYLLASKLFTFKILIGHIGLVLFITIFISICGLILGYSIIKNILRKIIFYAAQAKHSDQLKSIFVASVSHELKNPLTIIKMNILNVVDGLLGQINEEQRNVLAICHSVIERMSRLINDLLDLHKIEAGAVEVKRGLCNLVEILDKQIRECEALLSKKRIKLTKEIQEQDLSLWADEGKIMQVINNLLNNAIKYTPEEGSVVLKVFPTQDYMRLEFYNTGESIPEEQLEKIFDKFKRLEVEKEGTGLGLAISKDIVELHKGRIWAESYPGRGNKFIVILPHDLRKKDR
jgi:signal transduction histidine kinase